MSPSQAKKNGAKPLSGNLWKICLGTPRELCLRRRSLARNAPPANNGDGRDDILWQRNDGLVYVWLLNGTTITGAGALSGIDGSWSIVG